MPCGNTSKDHVPFGFRYALEGPEYLVFIFLLSALLPSDSSLFCWFEVGDRQNELALIWKARLGVARDPAAAELVNPQS